MNSIRSVNIRRVEPKIISSRGLISSRDLSVPVSKVVKQSNEKNKNREDKRNRDDNGEDMAVEVLGRRSRLREEKSRNVGRKCRKRRRRRRGRRRWRGRVGWKKGFRGRGK